MTDSIERKSACLDAAKAAVCGDRELNYGTPEDNFRRIATLWNAWMQVRKDPYAPLAPWEVAIMMDLMKSARLANSPEHQDSWIDKAGYAACGADITGKDAGGIFPLSLVRAPRTIHGALKRQQRKRN